MSHNKLITWQRVVFSFSFVYKNSLYTSLRLRLECNFYIYHLCKPTLSPGPFVAAISDNPVPLKHTGSSLLYNLCCGKSFIDCLRFFGDTTLRYVKNHKHSCHFVFKNIFLELSAHSVDSTPIQSEITEKNTFHNVDILKDVPTRHSQTTIKECEQDVPHAS